MRNLEELESYIGTTPVPEDFNEYWNRALDEMNETEMNISLTEADFKCPNAACYDLYFTGVDGARIYAKYLRPEKAVGKIPAILMFHGYSDCSGDWFDKLSFVQAGFAVLTLDCRGQGGKSEDAGGVKGTTFNGHIIRGLADNTPDKMLYRNIYLDAAMLAKIAFNDDCIDAKRVYTYGGSQGGALALACAALEPRIKRTAAIYPFLSDFAKTLEIRSASAYAELKDYFRRYDPRFERTNEIFCRLGYIDIKNLAPQIKAKVLMFTGLVDESCPAITQYAVYNNLHCEKRHIIYPEHGHDFLPGAMDTILQFFLKD